MAEGINRPMITESLAAYSRRLAKCDPPPDRFRCGQLLAEALVEEWRGFHLDPVKSFEVHVRGEDIVLRCRTPRAHGWHVAQKLARDGFAGRRVVLEQAWKSAALAPPKENP
jgi:hypothetical protein